MVAVETFANLQDLLQVVAQDLMVPAPLRLAQGCADQVFHQDGFLAMGFVLRRCGLEIKADSGSARRFNLRQLAKLLTRNHRSGISLSADRCQAPRERRSKLRRY